MKSTTAHVFVHAIPKSLRAQNQIDAEELQFRVSAGVPLQCDSPQEVAALEAAWAVNNGHVPKDSAIRRAEANTNDIR